MANRGALNHYLLVNRRLLAAFLTAGLLAVFAGVAIGDVGPNPANDPRLLRQPIEDYHYDSATRCVDRPRPGALALAEWLARHTPGELWGIVNCAPLSDERLSVHSEGRAIDWRLDARIRSERRVAMRLIRMLFEADRHDEPLALARRMGIQGLIFDCRAWWGGDGLVPYSYCEEHRHPDPTLGHLDHIHIELTKAGARKKTSFWRSPLADR